ncbi:ribokinase [soil metagenome]
MGSANLDVVLPVARRPEAGETFEGESFIEVPGGKGANQAIASAAVASTMFIGIVGDDGAGAAVAAALRRAAVDVEHLAVAPGPTGRAFVTLTPDGENSIIVMALANAHLSASAVTEALDEARPSVVLTQLEVPSSVTVAVAEWCARTRARLVLNPSPVRDLPPGVLQLADPLIVNEGEARAVLGQEDDLVTGLASYCRSVVLTAGARGAFVAHRATVTQISGSPVTVVDTTGAGDVFAGTLAAHLALGMDLTDAASRANAAAARVIQLARSAR